MLAARRSIALPGGLTERTPLLVPSFSSKGFPDADKILKTTAEVIEGPLLVSAYDLHYKSIQPPFDFAPLLFLDSGGYEAARDAELSDFGNLEHVPQEWSESLHLSVLSTWSPKSPTVVISYDHPRERLALKHQIARAHKTLGSGDRWAKELLLKPETEAQAFLQMKTVLAGARDLAGFSVIGVTEKEIGSSLLDRMVNIARLRNALTSVGLDTPIHVFGSLDTITTPMYFLAGADVFDGLTWLRFAYLRGLTLYKQNFGALELGLDTKLHMMDAHCWFHNYRYLSGLQLTMRRFLTNQDFGVFGEQADLFRKAYESTVEQVGR